MSTHMPQINASRNQAMRSDKKFGSNVGHRRNGRSRRRDGSVVLLVAGGLVAVCGFCALAVDYGRCVLMKNQLQRACDAGALAGVKYLPTSPATARQAAVYYAYQNNKTVVDPNAIQILPSTTSGMANTRIMVPAISRVNYLFGPVIRNLAGDIGARATAAAQEIGSLLPPNVVPIGITPSTYNAHKDGSAVTVGGIRQNKASLGTDEFVLFDLREQNSKSPAQMQNQLQWGSTFNEQTIVGGTETTLNAASGSQDKKFGDGMESRFNAANSSAYGYDNGTKFTSIPPGSPRVMYLILTPESQPVNGNNNALVKGFVPVYVEAASGDPMTMRIRFLPKNAGGGVYTDISSFDADSATARVDRLVD